MRNEAFALAQYVNDRPYAASSMLAVALGNVFRTAMAGTCEARPELAAQPIPLEHPPAGRAVARRAGPGRAAVRAARLAGRGDGRSRSTPTCPAWGDSPYVDLRLTGTLRLADALSQLYVLLPVLDDGKHYWVGDDEVDKLLRAGGDWLPAHPERELITRRYLRTSASLVARRRGPAGRGRRPARPNDEADEDAPTKPLADRAGCRGGRRR